VWAGNVALNLYADLLGTFNARLSASCSPSSTTA
jgi:hypothetical protein